MLGNVCCATIPPSLTSNIVYLLIIATEARFWRHHNLRIAYVAQHSFFHLGKHLQSSPVQYIQQRFKNNYDSENPSMKKVDDLELDKHTKLGGAASGSNGSGRQVGTKGKVEAILARRKCGKTLA